MKTALILAAGKGVRMLPLTKDVPKPLIQICGKPFIYYIFRNLADAGFEKVYLVVSYLKEKIESYVKENDFPFEVELIYQEEPLGTGHAVSLAKNRIEGNFFVIMGDNLYSPEDIGSVDIEDNYSYIFALRHDHPEKFGVLVTEDEFLIDVEEKPSNPKTNLINAGLYKFTPEIFEALESIEKSDRGEYELTSAIGILAKEKKIKVKVLDDYWVDLGKTDDVPKVEAFVRDNF